MFVVCMALPAFDLILSIRFPLCVYLTLCITEKLITCRRGLADTPAFQSVAAEQMLPKLVSKCCTKYRPRQRTHIVRTDSALSSILFGNLEICKSILCGT